MFILNCASILAKKRANFKVVKLASKVFFEFFQLFSSLEFSLMNFSVIG